MRTTPQVIKVLAATIAVLLTAQAAVLATTTRRDGGPLTSLRSVTEPDHSYTPTRDDFVLVKGMELTMSVPAGEQAQLVITFSGVSYCSDPGDSPSAWCLVQVVVDGSPVTPGTVMFDSAVDGGGGEAHSMQWVTGPLSSGPHVIRVKYRIDEPGTFTIANKTLTVLRSRV